MKIKNDNEVESWLFEHAQVQGHKCDGVKGTIPGNDACVNTVELVNVKYVDTITGEEMPVLYSAT